jgi:broad specificity phosphatase PhoE
MNEYYAIDKKTQKVAYKSASLFLLKNTIAYDKRDESEFIFTGDIGMRYLSKIVYVDNECVYNNKNFWSKDAQTIIEDYEEHEVIDFLGMSVDRVRFETELNAISSRIAAMDGTAGEVLYNIDTGNEMIALFKEECRLTNFVGITPMEIAVKLAPAYSLVMTGSFREAKQVFSTLEDDPFLTAERKKKYIDMLDAADAIDYATDDELIFTTKPTEELVDYVRAYLMDQSNDMTKEHTFYYAAMHQPDESKNPRFNDGDKLIYVIRHAERDSDSSSTTDINSTGVSRATGIGQLLAYGNAPSSTESGVTITIEANDAHYFANDLVRCKHTAQCIALGRGDTDSSADDYSGVTEEAELLYGYRYLKSHPDSGTTNLLKKYCNNPDELTESELAYIGVETTEEARAKIVSDTHQFINEIIAKADKTLNFFITSDYFVGCMQAGVTEYGYNQTNNNPWVNWCSGVAIVVHPDNTYDAFAVKCNKK